MKSDFLHTCHLQLQRGVGLGCLLVFFFLISSPAYAHKVHLFAYVDGDYIKTESRFNGGRPARGCDIQVQSSSSSNQDIAVNGKSDEKGFFHFPMANLTGDLDIIITCGDGHRGSWHLAENEYLFTEAEPVDHVHAQSKPVPVQVGDSDNDMLRQIIAEEVEKKVAPLRRELAQLAEHRTSLQDILGGIGYILGLAGLAAYMKFKKSK